jgi:hypothetical protein
MSLHARITFPLAFPLALMAASLASLSLVAACDDDRGGTPSVDANGVPEGDGGVADGPLAAGGSTGACAPATPGTYGGADFATNAAAELKLRDQLTAFLKPMREAAMDLALMPKASDLKDLFEAGTPSLRSITTSYYAPEIEGWLDTFEAAAGHMWMPTEPPPVSGGKYGPDIFSAEGLDIRQAIEKGMFAATFYNQALKLMKEPVTAATVDRLVALYGASPSFPAHDTAVMPGDTGAATYAKRRTKPDSPGIYFEIKADLVAAQAAARAGTGCEAALRTALESFRKRWEQVLFATVIYYAHDAKQKLISDNPTAAAISGGLHSIGEGLAFVHGFRGLPEGDRIIGDPQVDELLDLFGAPATGNVTVYKFATDTAAQATKLDQVVAKVKSIYGFTDQQMELFKVNH